MVSATVSFNPMQQTNAGGMFVLSSGGFIQGWQQPDPAARFALRQGVVASTETLLMIPGAAIGIATNPSAATSGHAQGSGSAGDILSRATTVAGIRGFTAYNNNYNSIVAPGATAPTTGSNMSMMYLPLGSRARICLGINAALASTFAAGADINTQVSWDFGGQMLAPYVAAYASQALTAASWSAGVATVTMAAVPSGIAVGDQVTITGMTPSGYNGSFAVTAVTSTTISYAVATNPGTETALGQLAAGGGAVPCSVLNVNIGNSLQIYQDANGLFQINNTGSCAEILI